MKDYTVILLYPDYLAENFGQDTWAGHVQAKNAKAAVAKARKKLIGPWKSKTAADVNGDLVDVSSDPDDFFLIAVFEGRHNDLKHKVES